MTAINRILRFILSRSHMKILESQLYTYICMELTLFPKVTVLERSASTFLLLSYSNTFINLLFAVQSYDRRDRQIIFKSPCMHHTAL